MHPQAEQKSIFRKLGRFGRWEWLVVLATVLSATIKKGSSTFGGRKVHTEKILATPMP